MNSKQPPSQGTDEKKEMEKKLRSLGVKSRLDKKDPVLEKKKKTPEGKKSTKRGKK